MGHLLMQLGNENKQLLKQQVSELNQKYQCLVYKQQDGKNLISGTLPFCALYNDRTIEDEYEIEIFMPDDYPNTPPTVKETKGRIPEEFHRNKDDDSTLCLGAPIAVSMKFKENPCLLHFVDQQVVPYLFSYSSYIKYGDMPIGELQHGGEGILTHYREVFDISDGLSVLGLLRILSDNDYRGHHSCPCGSGKRVRNCHGNVLRELRKYQNSDEFFYEYKQVWMYMRKSKKEIPESIMSNNLLKSYKNEKQKNLRSQLDLLLANSGIL